MNKKHLYYVLHLMVGLKLHYSYIKFVKQYVNIFIMTNCLCSRQLITVSILQLV